MKNEIGMVAATLGLMALMVCTLGSINARATETSVMRERFFCPAGGPIHCGYDENYKPSCGTYNGAESIGFFEAILDSNSNIRALRICRSPAFIISWHCNSGNCVPAQQQQQRIQQGHHSEPTLRENGQRPWDGEDCTWEFPNTLIRGQVAIAWAESQVKSQFSCGDSVPLEFFISSRD